MKRLIPLLFLALAIIFVSRAQGYDYNFADHTLSFHQIEKEWHNQNLYTATRADKADIRAYFLSLAQAYPNDFFDMMVTQMCGVDVDGFISNFVLDTRNGYISAELLTEFTNSVQMCYWRCNDGGVLVGVALQGAEYKMDSEVYDSEFDDDEEPATCVNDLMFFKIEKDGVIWWPKTPKEMCGADFKFCAYEIQLPREGKDITLTDTYNPRKNRILKWNGTNFTVKK